MSVSEPFWTVSLQLGMAQTLFTQLSLVQSVDVEQARPAGQPLHVGPPQSISVSAPFLTPSMQLGVGHVSFTHKLLVQSVATMQESPGSQLWQVPPPQSLSVSLPFSTESLQLADRHRLSVPHTPLAQSAPLAQPCPALHGGHDAPPQSTSLSSLS